MKTIEYTIKSDRGMHFRPASRLSGVTGSFGALTTITCGDKTANAKSLIRLLEMELAKDDEVTITFDGYDEDEAYDATDAILRKWDKDVERGSE